MRGRMKDEGAKGRKAKRTLKEIRPDVDAD
jgi:hypothetical protein